MAAEHLDHRRAFEAVLRGEPGEDRRFENAEPDIEADRDQHDADEERHPPSPGKELIAGDLAEGERGEVGEEEASATSRALAILRKKWGSKPFTARAVVQELAKANSLIEDNADQAAELADALGDLIGKVLEKPTARSVGKLFQKHLTNRPAFVEDGNCVAVLRKKSNDRANEYEIEIPGGDVAGEPWRATL